MATEDSWHDIAATAQKALATRLPPELWAHIVCLAGPEECIRLRHRFAFTRLIRSHLASGNCNVFIGARLASACVRRSWSQGLEKLVLAGLFPRTSTMPEVKVANVESLKLSSRAIKALTYRFQTLVWDRFEICPTMRTVVLSIVYASCALPDSSQEARALLFADPDNWRNGVLAVGIRHGDSLARLQELADSFAPSTVVYWPQDSTPAMAKATHAMAQYGRDELLQWVHEHHPERLHFELAHVALAHGHIATAEFIRQHCSPPPSRYPSLRPAMDEGLVRVAQQLYDWGVRDVHVADIALAAQRGHLQALLFLFDRGLGPFTESVADAAAKGGHLPILLWLHEAYGVTPTDRGLCQAVARGHLDVVQWMVTSLTIECTLEDLVTLGLGNGHLELAQWLNNQRTQSAAPIEWPLSPYGEPDFDPQSHGDLALAQWIDRHTTYLQHLRDHRQLCFATRSGNLDLVRWLHRRLPVFANVADILETAASYGLVGIVRWAHRQVTEHGVACSHAIDAAAGKGCLDALRYFHQHCPARCTPLAAQGARNMLSWDAPASLVAPTLRFLLEHYPDTCDITEADIP
ncbi:hypothetical protein RI367_001632 [Sorochytrium milnesiophthora]